MKVTYNPDKRYKTNENDYDIKINQEMENINKGLSDKFFYGYLITCGVIITILKIIT